MAILLLFLSLIFANENKEDKSNLVKVEVVKSHNTHNNQPFYLLIKLNIKDGWHTYWRNPGDSGMPTDIQFETQDNIKISDIIWTELPQRFPFDDMVNFGYDKVQNLIVKVEPNNNNKDITIKANVFWLVCKTECIPQDTSVTITIPYSENSSPNTDNLTMINNLIKSAPTHQDIAYSSAKIEGDYFVLETNDNLLKENKFTFFPYHAGFFANTISPIIDKNGENWTYKFRLDEYKIENPDKFEGLIVIGDEENSKAVEVNIPIE